MARASVRLGWAEPGVSARIAACLEKNGLPTGTDYPAEALAKAALADKKRSGDSITIVVPRAIGDCELKRIPVTELLPIIAAGLGGRGWMFVSDRTPSRARSRRRRASRWRTACCWPPRSRTV